MNKLMAFVRGLPGPAKMILAVALVGLLGYGLYEFSFSGAGAAAAPDGGPGGVALSMPSASVRGDTSSRFDVLERQSVSDFNSAQDYWDALQGGSAAGGDPSLVVNGGGAGLADVPGGAESRDDYLDPSEYSPLEIQLIRSGGVAKAQVDADHAREREREARRKADEAARRPLTQEEKDSLYFARLDKAMEIARKYQTDDAPHAVPAAEEAPANGYRKIDVGEGSGGGSYIPTDSFQDEGIISSIENPYSVPGGEGGGAGPGASRTVPARATFLRNEKLLSGQRVIMRLLQPLTLSNGVVIPANTHVTGTASVSDRLTIAIESVQYGGKMYHVSLDAYDNDGLEGIYCPVAEKKKGRRAGKNAARSAVSGIVGEASSFFTKSRAVGSVVGSGINELTSEALEDGSTAINIRAGYEFYIYENAGEAERNFGGR